MQLVRYTKISYGTRNAQTYEERVNVLLYGWYVLRLIAAWRQLDDPSVPPGPFGTEDQKW